MQVKVTKDNVFITEENKIHVGEYKVNKINFNFSEEYTSDLVINAIFTFNEKSYQTSIINNECNIPAEILGEAGNVIFGIYAYKINNEKLELRYSPYPANFAILNGSYNPTAEESQEITSSQFEEYMQALQDGLNEIQKLIEGIGDIEDLPNRLVPPAGTSGQILSKKSDADYDIEWVNSSSTGGTTNYNDLNNKPQINGVTLSGNKTNSDLGIKQTYTANDIAFTDGETFQQKYDAGELTGPKGDTGNTGPQGVQGETGPAGQDGANATINGQNTLNILAGTNISLDQQGTDLTINATGGSGGGATYTAGTNIEITEDNVINNTIPYNFNEASPYSVALGDKSKAVGTDSVSIGYNAIGLNSSAKSFAAIGGNSRGTSYSVSVGSRASSNTAYCVALGYYQDSPLYAGDIYIGCDNVTTGYNVGSACIAIGTAVKSKGNNTAVFGSEVAPINNMYYISSTGEKVVATTDLIDALETRIATLEAKVTELGGGE